MSLFLYNFAPALKPALSERRFKKINKKARLAEAIQKIQNLIIYKVYNLSSLPYLGHTKYESIKLKLQVFLEYRAIVRASLNPAW